MKKGFTLIELLIVVAIIGILAVALVPTITDAPARARDAGRKATVNSVITSLEAFNIDEGFYPAGTFCIDADGSASADETKIIDDYLNGNIPSAAPVQDSTVCGGEFVRYEKTTNGYQVYMPVEKTGNYGIASFNDGSENTLSEAAADGPGGANEDVFGIVR